MPVFVPAVAPPEWIMRILPSVRSGRLPRRAKELVDGVQVLVGIPSVARVDMCKPARWNADGLPCHSVHSLTFAILDRARRRKLYEEHAFVVEPVAFRCGAVSADVLAVCGPLPSFDTAFDAVTVESDTGIKMKMAAVHAHILVWFTGTCFPARALFSCLTSDSVHEVAPPAKRTRTSSDGLKLRCHVDPAVLRTIGAFFQNFVLEMRWVYPVRDSSCAALVTPKKHPIQHLTASATADKSEEQDDCGDDCGFGQDGANIRDEDDTDVDMEAAFNHVFASHDSDDCDDIFDAEFDGVFGF